MLSASIPLRPPKLKLSSADMPWLKLPNWSLEACATNSPNYDWAVIKPFLPNKPRGVPRVNDRRVLNGIFGPAFGCAVA